MEHHKRQGELLCYQSLLAEMLSNLSVCICYVDILIATYFKVNLAFICFILQLQISLTVLQFLNHNEASQPSRRTTIPSQPAGQDAVLYFRLYFLR